MDFATQTIKLSWAGKDHNLCATELHFRIHCGCFRAVHILPNRFLGEVGEHQFDVESLAVSHDRRFLLSCSHDQCLKFWAVKSVVKEKVDATKKAKHSTKSKKLGTTKMNDFFSGFAQQDDREQSSGNDNGDEDDSDSDSDSDW